MSVDRDLLLEASLKTTIDVFMEKSDVVPVAAALIVVWKDSVSKLNVQFHAGLDPVQQLAVIDLFERSFAQAIEQARAKCGFGELQ